MKGRNGILFAWAAFAVITAGCSTQPEPHTHTHFEDTHSMDEAREYLIENYPTRGQMIQARECTTARTGYEFDPLPDDYGPDLVAGLVETPAPRRARNVPNENEVDNVFLECVFDLGIQDRYYPPWDHETLRGYLAWRAERNS